MPEPRMPLKIENPRTPKPPEPKDDTDTGVPLEAPSPQPPVEPDSVPDDVTEESERGSFNVPNDNVTEETTVDFTI